MVIDVDACAAAVCGAKIAANPPTATNTDAHTTPPAAATRCRQSFFVGLVHAFAGLLYDRNIV
jgi:hypothetical protein